MFPVSTPEECPIAITDDEGILGPCDRPTTGWAWYDGPEHEPALTRACSWHQTSGADDIAMLAAAALPVPDAPAPSPARIATALMLDGVTPEHGYRDDEILALCLAARHGTALVEGLRPRSIPSLPWILADILDWWFAEIRFNGGELSETVDAINRIVDGTETFTIDDAHSDRDTHNQARHLLALWTRLTVGLMVRIETVAGCPVIITEAAL